MNAMDSRRIITTLLDDRRIADLDEDERRSATEIVDDWSVLIEDVVNTVVIQDVDDAVVIQDIDDTKVINATPILIGDYDDDIDR